MQQLLQQTDMQIQRESGRILIVDDDPDTCDMLTTLFGGRGYETSVAFSGEEALTQVERGGPDLVVLDIMMPGMDGWETYRRVRMHCDIPVIFLTALTSGECAARALSMGAGDYMRKPFHPAELVMRTATLLTNGRSSAARGDRLGEPGRSVAIFPVASIVIPAYNEAAGLPLVLEALYGVLDDTYEVVVVDDGSTDDTAVVAERFPCRLFRHLRNLGKGAALRTGLLHARGGSVIFLDADNTYPVEAIPTMARMLEECDLVRGIRFSGRANIPRLNRIGNLIFDGVMRALHAVEGGDILSGMYGGRRASLLELGLQAVGFDIEAEINVKAAAHGLRSAYVPITYASRAGEKKLNPLHDGLRILYRILQLSAAYSPLLAFVLPGLALLIAGLGGVALVTVGGPRLLGLPLATNGTYLLGVVGSLGAQLSVFGIAVYAAGMTYGLRGRANPALDRASEFLSTRTAMLAGLLLGSVGLIGVASLGFNWLARGHGMFTSTAALVVLSVCMLFGYQLLSSAVFLSALKGLRRKREHGGP